MDLLGVELWSFQARHVDVAQWRQCNPKGSSGTYRVPRLLGVRQQELAVILLATAFRFPELFTFFVIIQVENLLNVLFVFDLQVGEKKREAQSFL